MRECDLKQNQASCNCSYESCERKGICCQCVSYHRKKGQLPACFFPDDVESTYDRSIEKLVSTYQKRGRGGRR